MGLLDRFLEKTTIPFFGQDSTYHEDRETVLDQFRGWTRENKSFADWSDLIDEVDSILGEGKKRLQPEAATAIHTALTGANVTYAIQGSYAARLHGAPVGAGDIDVLVNNMRAAAVAFQGSGMKRHGGSQAVGKWRHANGTEIDLAMGEEFGVNVANSETAGGVKVLNTYEVLLGLALRPEKRRKEQDALFWLAKHKGDALTAQQKETVATRLGVGTWAKIIEFAEKEF